MKKTHFAIFTFAWFVLSVAGVCHANGGGAGGAGQATELTQLMNNGQLVDSVVKQAQMVSEQINSKLVAIQQYTTMMQNLQNYPKATLDAMLAPYQAQSTALNTLSKSVVAIQTAASQASSQLSARFQQAGAMGMDMPTYMQYEIANAQKRGGIYQARLNANNAAITNLQERANQLRLVSSQTSSITGNVQGLAQLNQQTTMVAGELMELRALMLQQNTDNDLAKVEQEKSNAATAEVMSRAAKKLAGQKAQNENIGQFGKNPWD